MARCHWA